jgi:osmotically-inducible protein OsmY
VVVGAQHAAVSPTEIAQQVSKRLMSLPYYGVFDLLTLNVADDGVVTLGGYVFMSTLKTDAEREAREIKGVTEVQNRIELRYRNWTTRSGTPSITPSMAISR